MSSKKLTADGDAAADVKHTTGRVRLHRHPCSPAVKSGNLLPTLRTSPGRNSLSPLPLGSKPEVVFETPVQVACSKSSPWAIRYSRGAGYGGYCA